MKIVCDEAKNALRREIRRSVALTCGDERNAAALEVMAALEAMPQFVAARTVALYAALPDEMPTQAMLDGWASYKRLVLPAIEDGRMVFREYGGGLSAGMFGIPEPSGGREVLPGEIDLMLVPGVAFDRSGRRLGRGKGFYDRYLSDPEAAGIYKVGVCLPCQLVGDVPCRAHDVAVDIIVTADGEK